MKTSFKRLTCLFLSILMLVSVVTVASVGAAEVADTATSADTIYVDTNGISNNYAYFAWVWQGDGSGTWHTMTKNGDYYEFQMTSGYKVVFSAMPAGTTNPDWNLNQAQTDNTAYDGKNNYCKLTLGGGKGLAFEWAVYSNGQVSTTAKPTPSSNQKPSINTTAPSETETYETHPFYPDEEKYMYVLANSNLDRTGVKVKMTTDTVTVTYVLTADKIVDSGQAVISYDSNKLELSTSLNTNATMFPNLMGVMVNMNAGVGKVKFNFSGINNDFTEEKVFVKLVFERKYKNVGTADVNLDVNVLSSKEVTYIEDGQILTTEGVKLTASAVCQEVQEPSEDKTVETDATTDITINASSNINDTITEIKSDKATVKITYSLTADEFITYGYGSVHFDDSVLALEDKYNSVSSIFTTVTSNVSYNLNAVPGEMRFAFNGVDAANKTGLYDFTNGGALVTLVFTVKSGATGSTDVKLNMEELASFDKEYFAESYSVNDGCSVVVEGVAEEATTAEPTKPVIATGVPTTDTSEVITAPASSSSTPTSSSSQTEPSSSKVTQPTTKPTQPATKAPSVKLNKSSIKSGAKTKIVVSNLNGKKVQKYTTGNKKIATVDKKGNITALNKGTVKITVKISGKNYSKTLKVSSAPVIKYKNKTLKSGKTITIKKGKTVTLKITGKASAIKNKVTVKSKKIAKIKSKATQTKVVFKAMKKGKATLTVKINGVKTFKYKIKVK